MRYPAHHRGFTLIEMIVTVSVLAILLTVAVPSFKDMVDKRRLVGAAEQFYGDLQAARFEAIKLNKTVAVFFTNSGSTNWCYGMADSISAACDCTASVTTTQCKVGGMPKVMGNSGFRGVTLTVSGYTNSRICVDSRRGKFFSKSDCTSDDMGNVTFSSSSGSIRVDTQELGRVRICSTAGTGGYPSCS